MVGRLKKLEVSDDETMSLVRLLAYTAMAIYYTGRVALLIV
jgi:hypothetical protein